MRDLNHQLKQLCLRNRDGSFATQHDRERVLTLIADQLHALGFRGMGIGSLKPKHVDTLVDHWQRTELSVGTIKNRPSDAALVGREGRSAERRRAVERALRCA